MAESWKQIWSDIVHAIRGAPPAPAAPSPGEEPWITVGLAWDLNGVTIDPQGAAVVEAASAKKRLRTADYGLRTGTPRDAAPEPARPPRATA